MPENSNPPTVKRLGFLISRTSWAMRRRVQGAIKSQGFNFTPEQWVAINLLSDFRLIPQVELAKLMNKDKASVTRIIESLVSQNLVERSADAADARKQLVALSARGLEVKDDLAPKVFAEYSKMIEGISEQEQELAANILVRICNNAE
ncbi:MAG: MarR family transcriptional regulator [SAR324 cluster bacterium]|nr:MarR family transcriptional regulator [SAR324 cluster bacterium]